MSTLRFVAIIATALLITTAARAAEGPPGASEQSAGSTSEGYVTPADVIGHGLAAATGIPPAIAIRLRELSKRFGDPCADMIKDNLVGIQELEEYSEEELRAWFEQIDAAIALSNTGGDFRSPPVSCGDELYDLVATTLYPMMLDHDTDSLWDDKYALVPRGKLTEWQEQYAGDYRFYELRFLTELYRTDLDYQVGVDYLHAAAACPNATVDTVLFYYLAELEHLKRQAGEDTAALTEGITARWDDLNAILDRAREVDPDNAWPDYFEAELHFRCDRIPEGINCIRRGNAQPHCEYPRPDLIRFALDHIHAAAPYGNAAVNGAAMIYIHRLPVFDAKLVKGVIEDSLAGLTDDGAGIELINTWYRFGYRWGMSWPENPIVSLYGAVVISKVNKRYEELLWDDDPVAIENAKHIRGAVRTGTGIHRNHAGRMDISTLEIFYAADSETGVSVWYYLDEGLHALAVVNEVMPIFSDLAQVSFPLDEPIAVIEKYPPLRQEDVKAFKAGTFDWDGMENPYATGTDNHGRTAE